MYDFLLSCKTFNDLFVFIGTCKSMMILEGLRTLKELPTQIGRSVMSLSTKSAPILEQIW